MWDLVSLSAEQVPELFATGEVPDSAEGPALPMRVVGVVRTTADIAARPDEPAVLMLSPAFFDQYRDRVGMGAITHLVRLVDEPDALDQFTDAAAAAYPDGQLSFDVVQAENAQSDAIGVATVAVLALGLVVALAGGAWIATAAIRQQRLLTPEMDVFRALGLTPSERAGLLVGAVAPGLTAGAVLAPVVAIALSPLFPVGLARRYEPDVGVLADVPVLLLGLVIVVLVLATITLVGAWRLVGRHDRPSRSRPPRLDRLIGALPPAPAMGVRFALLPPRTIAAPVRPAVAGACLAVIGIAAVAIVGASLDRVVDDPARWGTTWDLALITDDPSVDPTPLLDDPGLAAVAFGRFDEQVTIDDVETLAMTIEPVRGDIGFTVVEGRAPQAPDEVVVGRTTLDRLDADVGSSVQIGSRSVAAAPFRIVGVAVFPTLQFSYPLDDGAGFDARAGQALGLGDETRDDAGFPAVLVRFAPDADQTASLARFTDAGLQVVPPTAPPEVNGLDDVKWFPTIGASLLVVLGGIATSQAIAVTTRRRRRELGVLSVLGFTPGQRRGLVAAQATSIAVVALAIGIPLGIATARLVWGAIAGSMGLATDISVPVATLVLGSLVVVVALERADRRRRPPGGTAARRRRPARGVSSVGARSTTAGHHHHGGDGEHEPDDLRGRHPLAVQHRGQPDRGGRVHGADHRHEREQALSGGEEVGDVGRDGQSPGGDGQAGRGTDPADLHATNHGQRHDDRERRQLPDAQRPEPAVVTRAVEEHEQQAEAQTGAEGQRNDPGVASAARPDRRRR